MFLVVADLAVTFLFIPGLGEVAECDLVETVTAESVVIGHTVKLTTETSGSVDVFVGDFDSDGQTSVPVNADLVVNDNLEVVVGVNHPDSCTDLLGVLVGADDDGVWIGCLQFDWLVKDVCEDLDEIHAHL